MSENIMRQHMSDRFGRVFNFHDNPPLPKSLNIELNNTCNHNCIFCRYHGKYANNKPKPATMSVDNAKKILYESKKLGIGEKEVGFYLSGEVFLYNDLAEVIRYAKSLGFKYTFITTNGSLATPDRMKEVLDAGLDSIRFSINGMDKKTYKEIHGRDDFDEVCRNLKYMHKYIKDNSLKVATSISCVLTKKTRDIQDNVKDLLGEYVDDIVFFPVILARGLNCNDDFIKDNQYVDDSKLEINHDYVCPMLFDTMYITANLEVVPCCEALYYVFYDLKTNMDLVEAWNSESYRKYRKMFLNRSSDEGTICEDCLLRKGGTERYFF